MTAASTVERQMLELMNAARAKVGLDPLKLALDLNTSAENHSEWMLAADVFSHTGAGGSNAGQRMTAAGFDFTGSWSWGENIAWQSERGAAGISDDAVDLFNSLMNSPGHRANILSANFDYVGIGIERGNYNGWDAVMVTQNFASTGARVALDTGATASNPANTAPVVTMDDLTVANVKSGAAKKAYVADALDVTDADGDQILFYEVRDTTGRQNFKLQGEPGKLDARDGYVIDADDIDRLLVLRNKNPGDTTLEIRASDGDDWSAWESFTLHTVTAEDYFA
ncbi:MAG: CAP domain-containing protein [Maritimibacter sp.]|nr:CAP domain-containing protein [Maritimibacter sp.]